MKKDKNQFNSKIFAEISYNSESDQIEVLEEENIQDINFQEHMFKEALFEKYMEENFDEPEWDEGYTRADLQDAFEAGMNIGNK